MSKNPLYDLIELEELDTNLFRGHNYLASWGRVFGGQVLAQSLNAADRSVPDDRQLHSMHGYFILGGDLDAPIIYQVECIRDGKSFNTRRVVAFQHGKAIFNMSASFQVKEEGFSHQYPMPNVTSYKDLISDEEWMQQNADKLPDAYKKYLMKRHIEFRPVERIDVFSMKPQPPIMHIWMKSEEPLPDHPSFHKQVLAFASDYNLMTASALPHRGKFKPGQLIMTSLDHGMWFHQDFRADEWLLFEVESTVAHGSRGFSRGSFFNENGDLVASVTQEGLIRMRRDK